MKVVFLLGGKGKRMRPVSYFLPKCLLPLGGKPILGRIMDNFTYPEVKDVEFCFILNRNHHARKIFRYLLKYNAGRYSMDFFFQGDYPGQSGGIFSAKEHLSGPCLIVFPDTFIEYDMSPFCLPPKDNFVWVCHVNDISQLGHVKINVESGSVDYIEEKNGKIKSGFAVTGYYYFSEGVQLLSAIKFQIEMGLERNNEYYLSDAVNILLAEQFNLKMIHVDDYITIDTPKSFIQANKEWRKK